MMFGPKDFELGKEYEVEVNAGYPGVSVSISGIVDFVGKYLICLRSDKPSPWLDHRPGKINDLYITYKNMWLVSHTHLEKKYKYKELP